MTLKTSNMTRRQITLHRININFQVAFFADNVPVKSKLQLPPPPGNPPGIWIFGKFMFKFPPPRAKKLFKCPIIGPFQVIRCPHPWAGKGVKCSGYPGGMLKLWFDWYISCWREFWRGTWCVCWIDRVLFCYCFGHCLLCFWDRGVGGQTNLAIS